VVVSRDLLGHESIATTNGYVAAYEGESARAVQLL
jgi:hypothetical protein